METFGLQKFYTPFDRDYQILVTEHTIEMEKLDNEFRTQLAFGLLDNTYYKESDKADGLDIVEDGIFSKIVKSIKRFIQNVQDMIMNIVSKEGNVDLASYKNSDAFTIRADHDIQKIDKIIDNELLKSRKVVQAIASKTGYPDDAVAQLVDGAARQIDSVGPSVIRSGVYFAFRKGFKDSLNRKEKEVDRAYDIAKANYKNLSSKQKEQIKKVLLHMDSLVKKGSSNLKSIFTMKKHKNKEG